MALFCNFAGSCQIRSLIRLSRSFQTAHSLGWQMQGSRARVVVFESSDLGNWRRVAPGGEDLVASLSQIDKRRFSLPADGAGRRYTCLFACCVPRTATDGQY